MTSRWTLIGGVRMHALEWGTAAMSSGPAIVLVHGLGVSSRYMVPLGDQLGSARHVFAPDLPGFGRSSSPAQPFSIADHARALEEWIRASDIGVPVLIGNSYGCQVIAELAVQTPSLACALILSAPTVEKTRRSALGEAGRLLRDAPRERLALLPIVIRDYLRAGPRRMIFTLRDAIADRIEDKLPRVTIPTLIVRGARDPIVSHDWITFLAAQMRSATTATLPDAPHAVNFSAARDFAAAVIAFVESIPAAAPRTR